MLLPFTPIAAPVTSILVARFSTRPVVMVGGLLYAVGLIGTSFAINLNHAYICYGFVSGIFFIFAYHNVVKNIYAYQYRYRM